jgi:peroxiredoxin
MIRQGDAAPDFTLPAVMDTRKVSLADELRAGAVLLGLFRGLHCPFCRRQIAQLSLLHAPLAERGTRIVVVVNTTPERAYLYFRQRALRVTLLADADARTHRRFGLPCVGVDDAFAAARINPTGELAAPMHPMEANTILNARDGFRMTSVDEEILRVHGTQLGGHFLIGPGRIVRWASIEGERGIGTVATFPTPHDILSAVAASG